MAIDSWVTYVWEKSAVSIFRVLDPDSPTETSVDIRRHGAIPPQHFILHQERCESHHITNEFGNVMAKRIECVFVFTVFLYCFVYVYLFFLVTSVRTTATE
jgi:hypothetical protein